MGTISQYHTQFSKFGSELLTRDFKQDEQHIQTRLQKKKKMSCYGWPKILLKIEAGKSASIFFVEENVMCMGKNYYQVYTTSCSLTNYVTYTPRVRFSIAMRRHWSSIFIC